jgi:hypothetical protein
VMAYQNVCNTLCMRSMLAVVLAEREWNESVIRT